MRGRHLVISLAASLLAAAAGASVVFADMPRSVVSAFRGQLVISQDAPQDGKSDKDMIALIEAARVKEVAGTTAQSITNWRFHYMAFLTKTGAPELTLRFRNGGRVAATKRLTGLNPSGPVLTGYVAITEAEGLARGTTYTLELADGKNSVVAKTTLTLK